MSKVTTNNRNHKVIRHGNGKVDVWGKNSAGCTKKELHTTYNPKTRMTTDHYGRKVSKGSSSGWTKPFKK